MPQLPDRFAERHRGTVLVILAPGQGSQTAGMLSPWLQSPNALSQLHRWSAALDLDLLELGCTAEAPALRPTAVAQPLLTAAALLSGRALLAEGVRPRFGCGHSVGEIAITALAGVITDDEAIALAGSRGALMAAATEAEPGGMTALLGGALSEDEVRAAGLEVATVNAPGQVVLGGRDSALTSFTPPAGVRARRLDVAGAFHTSLMASARDGFAALIAGLSPQDARFDVVANADGAVLRDGQEILARLVGQLTGAVRFDRCVDTLLAAGVDEAVELAPGGTLTAILRRSAPSIASVAVKHPDDLASASASASATAGREMPAAR